MKIAPTRPPASFAVSAARMRAILDRMDGGAVHAHGGSFRHALRLFPPPHRARVRRLYAWCRCADELADGPEPERAGVDRAACLGLWLRLSRRAYGGDRSGIPAVDGAMEDMAAGGVPFRYAEELVEGVRRDLRFSPPATVGELDRYAWRVASVVGLWMTELFGIRDPWRLRRAAELSRAMQLTNSLRDGGEDWRQGRVYLPLRELARRDLSPADIGRLAEGSRPLPEGYVDLVEWLMARAERGYRAALDAVPSLPRHFRRPVAVAAFVYRGIHDEIRAAGHDNLGPPPSPSRPRRVALGLEALFFLGKCRRWSPLAPDQSAAVSPVRARSARSAPDGSSKAMSSAKRW